MDAIYISNNSFKVLSDKTSEFIPGRRLKLDCGSDGIVYATVSSSYLSGSETIINIKDGTITSNLTDALYGVVSPGTTGSVPEHTHNGDEGSGGQISFASSFLALTDTPTTYSGSKYLRTTNSGIEFVDIDVGTNTHAQIDTHVADTENPHTVTALQVLPDPTAESGKFLTTDGAAFSWAEASSASDFLSLTDTPATYSGTEGLYAKSTGYGIVWTTVSGGSTVQSLIDLSDTPTTYSGSTGMYARSTGSGIEWATVSGGESTAFPYGGLVGQVLVKTSNNYGDVEWRDAVLPDGRQKGILHLPTTLLYGSHSVVVGGVKHEYAVSVFDHIYQDLDFDNYNVFSSSIPDLCYNNNATIADWSSVNIATFVDVDDKTVFVLNNNATVIDLNDPIIGKDGSWSFWIKLNTFNTLCLIFGGYAFTDRSRFYVGINADSAMSIGLHTSSFIEPGIGNNAFILDTDRWYHMVVTWTGASTCRLSLYIDGELIVYKEDTGTSYDLNAYIGYAEEDTDGVFKTTRPIDALVAEVKSFSKALAVDEVISVPDHTYSSASILSTITDSINSGDAAVALYSESAEQIMVMSKEPTDSLFSTVSGLLLEVLPREFSLESLTEVPEPTADKTLKRNSTNTAYEWADYDLISLTDTPTTYSGTEGLYAKSTGSGIVWAEGGSDVESFIDLSDTPTTYSGSTGMYAMSTGADIYWNHIAESDITDLDKYTKAEVDTFIDTISGSIPEYDVATVSGSGLLPALSGNTGEFLDGTGSFVGVNGWRSFDIEVSNPLPTTNPTAVGASWLNTDTGEMFYCIDNTTDRNVWASPTSFLYVPVYAWPTIPDWTDFQESLQFLAEKSYGGILVTRSNMGADLSGTGKWLGGVLGPDGKIYGIPSITTDILIIDPAAGTATRSNMGVDLSGTSKWLGGVLGPDGKIYGIPLDSTDILIIDPVAGTATRSNMGAALSGTGKWFGGVLGPDGKIYGIPSASTDILIIDPVAGTATRSNMGVDLSGTYKWLGGVLGPDGKIYGIPLDSTDILIIDPVAGTATRSNMGAALSGTGKWFGGVLGPDGKIYGTPYNATDILIIDPVAGTATRSNMGAALSGTNKWLGGVLGPDGKIYEIPRDSTDILIIDPAAGTATRSNMGVDLSGTGKWYSGVLGPDGKIYGIPKDSTDILTINIPNRITNIQDIASSPYLNKF